MEVAVFLLSFRKMLHGYHVHAEHCSSKKIELTENFQVKHACPSQHWGKTLEVPEPLASCVLHFNFQEHLCPF